MSAWDVVDQLIGRHRYTTLNDPASARIRPALILRRDCPNRICFVLPERSTDRPVSWPGGWTIGRINTDNVMELWLPGPECIGSLAGPRRALNDLALGFWVRVATTTVYGWWVMSRRYQQFELPPNRHLLLSLEGIPA